MNYNTTYEIEIKLEDQLFDYALSNVSFNLKDSIFNFYPVASFEVDDIRGLFNEYLSFINGTKVDITYGTAEEYFNCPYNIVKNSLPDQSSAGGFGGLCQMSLIHNYFMNQTKTSRAYKDEISSIVKKLTDKFRFKTTYIEKTLNKGYWYQPLVNDATFISEFLLPFAYSPNASQTPFFSFINSNNEFYFQSYHAMMSQGLIEELEFTPKGMEESLARNSIQALYTQQTSISDIRDGIHQIIYSFEKDGSTKLEDEIITDLLDTNKVLPIIYNTDNITNYYDVYSEDVKDDHIKNNNTGLKLFSKRNLFTVDKVVILINLNRTLCAGKKIKITVPVYSDTDMSDVSPRYSGEYLIESSYHSWNSKKGATVLIASRQNINIPSTYRNKRLTIQ